MKRLHSLLLVMALTAIVSWGCGQTAPDTASTTGEGTQGADDHDHDGHDHDGHDHDEGDHDGHDHDAAGHEGAGRHHVPTAGV